MKYNRQNSPPPPPTLNYSDTHASHAHFTQAQAQHINKFFIIKCKNRVQKYVSRNCICLANMPKFKLRMQVIHKLRFLCCMGLTKHYSQHYVQSRYTLSTFSSNSFSLILFSLYPYRLFYLSMLRKSFAGNPLWSSQLKYLSKCFSIHVLFLIKLRSLDL